MDVLKNLKLPYDKYDLEARYFPTLIALAPLFLISNYLFQFYTKANFLTSLLSGSLITTVLMYLTAEIVRNLGKYYEFKLFRSELYFPTTEYLLHKNTNFSKDKRTQVHTKLKADFNCILSTPHEEEIDENYARQRAKEAVGLIRQKISKGRLLLMYNIRYGFWRNLIGASLFSCFFSTIDIIFFILIIPNFVGLTLSVVLLSFYSGLFLLRKQILEVFGFQYAEQFFLEYLIS